MSVVIAAAPVGVERFADAQGSFSGPLTVLVVVNLVPVALRFGLPSYHKFAEAHAAKVAAKADQAVQAVK